MIRRILLLSICFSIILINVSAQDNPFPNEIDGLQFTKQATFRSLKFLISTKDDIASVFGRNCIDTCRYDDNWNIDFYYIAKEEKHVATKNGVKLTYKLRPEFIGKLRDVDLIPRKPYILSESLVFPKGLYCKIPTEFPNPEKIKVCWDGSAVAYRFYTEDDPGGRYKKNQVVVISYVISNENRKNMFETEPDQVEPKEKQ